MCRGHVLQFESLFSVIDRLADLLFFRGRGYTVFHSGYITFTGDMQFWVANQLPETAYPPEKIQIRYNCAMTFSET